MSETPRHEPLREFPESRDHLRTTIQSASKVEKDGRPGRSIHLDPAIVERLGKAGSELLLESVSLSVSGSLSNSFRTWNWADQLPGTPEAIKLLLSVTLFCRSAAGVDGRRREP
jgi:hypothetical protein